MRQLRNAISNLTKNDRKERNDQNLQGEYKYAYKMHACSTRLKQENRQGSLYYESKINIYRI